MDSASTILVDRRVIEACDTPLLRLRSGKSAIETSDK